jgi:hypothetical protein
MIREWVNHSESPTPQENTCILARVLVASNENEPQQISANKQFIGHIWNDSQHQKTGSTQRRLGSWAHREGVLIRMQPGPYRYWSASSLDWWFLPPNPILTP